MRTRFSALLTPVLLLTLLFSLDASAQIHWTQTNGPEGGTITAVTVDSTSRLFIGTATGGVFESSDRGVRWYPRNTGLTSFHVMKLESSKRGYIYGVTTDAGIFRYLRDDEPHWVPLDTTRKFGNISSLAVAPNNTVFAGTGQYGVLRSTDNGATWTSVSQDFKTRKDSTIALLTVSPSGRLTAVTSIANVFYTDDLGDHWTQLPTSPTNSSPTAVLPTPDGSIFLGDKLGRVYRTTNNGQSWTTCFTDPEGASVYSVVRSRANGHLFARYNSGKLYRSTNNGDAWSAADSIESGGDFYPSAIDESGTYYVGSDFEGLFRSENDGNSFEFINSHLIANLTVDVATDTRDNVYAVTEDFVWRSSDSGTSWHRLPFEIGEAFVFAPIAIDSSGHVYVGTPTGIYESSDAGENWTHPVSSSSADGLNQGFAIAVARSGSVFAGTSEGLFRRQNGVWKHLDQTIPPGSVGTVVIGYDGAVYVEDYMGTLYRSTDDGDTWTGLGVSSGVTLVTSSARLYRLTNRHLYYSDDTTGTWTELFPRGLAATNPFVFDIYLDRQNYLLAATDSGIYIQQTDGSWLSVSDSLQDPSATRYSAISKVVEARSGLYYAAARGQGIYRGVPVHSSVRTAPSVATGFALGQNYPNPFKPSTTIPFTVDSRTDVTLEVRNALGDLVWSKTMRALEPGDYKVNFADESLPSGTYFCRARFAGGELIRTMHLIR